MVKLNLRQTKGSTAAAKAAAGIAKTPTQASNKGKPPPQPQRQPSKVTKPSAAAKSATPAKQTAKGPQKKARAPVLNQDHEDGDEDENADAEGQPEDEEGGEGKEEVEVGEGDEGHDNEPDEPLFIKRLRRLDVRASLEARKKNGTAKLYDIIRVLIRQITEYCNPTRILTDALVLSTMDPADLPSAVSEDFDEDVLSEMLWPEFIKWLPELEEHLPTLSADPDLLDHVGRYILGIAKKTRSDDIPRVKGTIIQLAGIIDPEHVFDDKSNRGFQNTATARYLCPASEIDDFEQDPVSYCRLARKNKKYVLSEDWPMLCYDQRLHDVRDPKAGLFRSPLAIKVYKLIFTGKGSALDEFYKAAGNMKGKLPVSKRAKLEKVTIGSIVYVHLHMRFAFNSQMHWQDSDGDNWNSANFARSIFNAAFECPKWAAELEAWWTSKIFGSGCEDPPELKQKRKTTALELFKRASERRSLRREESPEEWNGINVPVYSRSEEADGDDGDDGEEEDNDDGKNNARGGGETGIDGDDGYGANEANGGQEPHDSDAYSRNSKEDGDLRLSGVDHRVKRKITDWQPDLSAIEAGPGPSTKHIKPTPKNRSQARSPTDDTDVNIAADGGSGRPDILAVREVSDIEDMYAGENA